MWLEVLFFVVVPVVFTCYLQTASWDCLHVALPVSVSVGLLAANVLVVNNYRDMEDDAAVGKRTTVVIFGRRVMAVAYLLSGVVAMALMYNVWRMLPVCSLIAPALYLVLHLMAWRFLLRAKGSGLNAILGRTAVNLLLFALFFLLTVLLA